MGGGGWGGVGEAMLQLLMLSEKLRKSESPYVRWREWGGGGDYVWGELQSFDKKVFHLLRSTASQIVSAIKSVDDCDSG